MTQLDAVTVAIDADTRAFRREINEATALAGGFGRAMMQAFDGAILRGRDFGDVMRSIALRLSNLAVGSALRPLEQNFAALLQGLFTPKLAAPAAGPPLNILPFARGGVVAAPSYFPMGPALGLAGEAGREAILPLSRGADGRLGVRGEGGARPLHVTVNIATPDAASFRRSEAYLSAAIARAVARGERNL